MENEDIILVIAFDLTQGGRSIIAERPMLKNAYEISLGTTRKKSLMFDLRSRMLQVLQCLGQELAEDGDCGQQTQDTVESACVGTLELDYPSAWRDYGNFRCELLEKESNPVCQMQAPTRLVERGRSFSTVQSENKPLGCLLQNLLATAQ